MGGLTAPSSTPVAWLVEWSALGLSRAFSRLGSRPAARSRPPRDARSTFRLHSAVAQLYRLLKAVHKSINNKKGTRKGLDVAAMPKELREFKPLAGVPAVVHVLAPLERLDQHLEVAARGGTPDDLTAAKAALGAQLAHATPVLRSPSAARMTAPVSALGPTTAASAAALTSTSRAATTGRTSSTASTSATSSELAWW